MVLGRSPVLVTRRTGAIDIKLRRPPMVGIHLHPAYGSAVMKTDCFPVQTLLVAEVLNTTTGATTVEKKVL
jgi:hypothetical protein